MKPETVLGLKNGEEPKAKLQEWLKEYAAMAALPGTKDLVERLSNRAENACALILERRKPEPSSSSHDDMYYIETAKIRDDEDASFDGDFLLGNEADAAFAGNYFSVSELAKIQCGQHHLIVAGSFNGYNFDVLVRKGFLAELNGDYPEAVRCYEGVPTSKSVQDREYECRRHMATEGDRCYEKALALMESGEWGEAFEPLNRAADMGHTDAFWQMAQYCQKENDPDGATAWFNKAIEAGQMDALMNAAAVYLDRTGDFYNEKLARQYLRRAADSGSVRAIIALADLELVDTDIPFWQQAAQLRDIAYPDKRPKRKVREQHKKQMAWYRLAAEAGDTDAMNALSMAYHLGYPESRDDEQAFVWASRAADLDDGSAMYQAAYLYENGFGTDRDIDAALLLYTEAAEQGVRSAMIRLYDIYTKGLGTIQPDGQKAAHYFWMSGEGRD